jgi:hypothetical protein
MDPVAVVQGLSMTIGWCRSGRGRAGNPVGALWVTANLDAAPCRPSVVWFPATELDRRRSARAPPTPKPLVAGKPATCSDGMTRWRVDSFSTPAGGRATDSTPTSPGPSPRGLPSLMVLTGVGTAADAAHAGIGRRPTYLAHGSAGPRAEMPRSLADRPSSPTWSYGDRRPTA